jgi:hypothetical protein
MAIAPVAAEAVGRDVAREQVALEAEHGDAAAAAARAHPVGGALELDAETGEDVEEFGQRRLGVGASVGGRRRAMAASAACRSPSVPGLSASF